MDRELYQSFLNILEEELLPAMGCTEPIAVAYCAAEARRILGAEPEQAVVEASGNIIKNAKSVVVPNTGGLRGIPAAAAAGMVAGVPEQKLEVLSRITPAEQEAIRAFLARTPVEVRLADTGRIFDLTVTVRHGADRVRVRIADYHTNIVLVEKNGRTLYSTPLDEGGGAGLTDRSLLTVERILEFADMVEPADVRPLLERQISCNMAIAEEGLRGDYGANLGSVLLTSQPALAAAGSDARMNGCELPVVINSGSGNQGITASVPVVVYARGLGLGDEKLLRALTLSNLIGIHLKTPIGRLSAFCGAISAGAAAGCGIAYLLDGSLDAVSHTLVNALAIDSGVICDGAKASCAGKTALAVDNGILGYEMYCQGQQFFGGDGIVKKGVENMIASVGRLGREGMRETDKEILHIMIDQWLSGE